MTAELLKAFAEQDKRLESLKSRAAVRGIVLVLLDDGHGGDLYVATQGFWERAMGTMDEVDSFLAQFEGKR